MARFNAAPITISNEEAARTEILKIDVSEEAAHIMAPKAIFRVMKLHGVRNAVGNILKQEMLSIGGEVAVSQYTVNCARPSTDVLIMGTLKQFYKLIQKMKVQGWVLEKERELEYKEIADEIEKALKESL
ncbi:MAG TPA: hypothetical protein VJI13_05615 [Candidatus Norongarragalinales archaeon]|nr:hypothetical protein [Candidatus Norongarragalinales archaeon]